MKTVGKKAPPSSIVKDKKMRCSVVITYHLGKINKGSVDVMFLQVSNTGKLKLLLL